MYQTKFKVKAAWESIQYDMICWLNVFRNISIVDTWYDKNVLID